jgi:hypothetical protein
MFRAADYFNLFDRYAMSLTDVSTHTASISFDDKSTSVIDYDGLWVGMPEAVMDIEDSVTVLRAQKCGRRKATLTEISTILAIGDDWQLMYIALHFSGVQRRLPRENNR